MGSQFSSPNTDRLSHRFGNISLSGQSRAHLGNVIHNHPAPLPSPPNPRLTIPFCRDINFVGRGDILSDLKTRLNVPGYHNRVALTGLGGVGKSQIAIEYSHRYSESNPDRWVFWVYAASEERFVESYCRIGVHVGFLRLGERSSSAVEAVSQWLSNPENGAWLMIVDNADDDEVLFQATDGQRPLADRIPQCVQGAVLITSRSQTGVDIAMGVQNEIRVPVLDERTSLHLLGKKLERELNNDNEAKELVSELDHIPLAITQAARFISCTKQSIAYYVQLFRQEERRQVDLLGKEWRDLRRDNSVSNAVLTTWKLTYNRLASESPAAIDLLARMSLLDHACIPETLVLHDGSLNIEQMIAIGRLLQYDLCQRLVNGSAYNMHRLVGLCTRTWLGDTGTLESSKMHVAMLLAAKISYKRLVLRRGPTEVGYDWEKLQELEPHLLVSLRCLVGQEASHAEASICDALCEWYCTRGDYRLAAHFALSARNASATKLGKKHEDSLGRLVHSINLRFCQNVFSFGFGDLWMVYLEVEDALGETHPHALALQEIIMVMASKSGVSRKSILQIGNRILAISDVAFETMSKPWASTRFVVATTFNLVGSWREAHEIQLDRDVRTLQAVNATRRKDLFGWFLDRITDELAADPLRSHGVDPELVASMSLRKASMMLQVDGLVHADTLLHKAATQLKAEKLKSQNCVEVIIEVAKAYHANGQPEKGYDLLRKMRSEYDQDVSLELDNVEELRASWEERVRSTPLIRCTDEKVYCRLLRCAGMSWAMDN